MNIKLKTVLLWTAIAFAYILILGTPMQEDVDRLQAEVDSLEKIVKEQDEKILTLGKVVQDNVKLIDRIYECNPYCRR